MGNRENGTGDSPPGDQHDNADETCEYCGNAVDTSDWYPATTERDMDGELRIYAFCSEACKEAWLADRSE